MRVFYWLTVIILVATYCGNLAATLTVDKVKMPFTTLQGLADNQDYTLVIKAGTNRETLFKVLKTSVIGWRCFVASLLSPALAWPSLA